MVLKKIWFSHFGLIFPALLSSLRKLFSPLVQKYAFRPSKGLNDALKGCVAFVGKDFYTLTDKRKFALNYQFVLFSPDFSWRLNEKFESESKVTSLFFVVSKVLEILQLERSTVFQTWKIHDISVFFTVQVAFPTHQS